jgi:hypothetical protein
MPYRIKARNKQGHSVTRVDQNINSQPITNHALALQIAEDFASTRGHSGPWTGYVEYYAASDSVAATTSNTPGRTATKLKPGNVRVE